MQGHKSCQVSSLVNYGVKFVRIPPIMINRAVNSNRVKLIKRKQTIMPMHIYFQLTIKGNCFTDTCINPGNFSVENTTQRYSTYFRLLFDDFFCENLFNILREG